MSDITFHGLAAIDRKGPDPDKDKQRLAALTVAEVLGNDPKALREVLDLLDLSDPWRTRNDVQEDEPEKKERAAHVRGKARLNRWHTTPMR